MSTVSDTPAGSNAQRYESVLRISEALVACSELQYWKAIRKITSISKVRWFSLKRTPAYFCFHSGSFLNEIAFSLFEN